MGFLADRTGHFGPQGFEFFFGFVTAHALQRARQHHRDARQRHFSRRQGLALGPLNAGFAQGLHHFAVVRLVKKGADAVRHDRPDIGHFQQRFFARHHDGFKLAKVSGQFFGRGLAHMANAQTEQKAAQCGLL